MLEYDLVRLFEHPLKFRFCIPSAIITFGGSSVGRCVLQVEWRVSASGASREDELTLSWDVVTLRPHFHEVDDEVAILRDRDQDRATRTELAAVVVAVAVLAHIAPHTRFTRRSATGTGHDYYLNETHSEMIEIAGRWEGGLPGLFEEKREQSNQNPTLRKRWVSVTIMRETPRNRTEGLHHEPARRVP